MSQCPWLFMAVSTKNLEILSSLSTTMQMLSVSKMLIANSAKIGVSPFGSSSKCLFRFLKLVRMQFVFITLVEFQVS